MWIYAASFEFFKSGGDGNIEGARVLIQRGTRLNPLSKKLWLQCFALDLHFWMKLVSHAIVLKLEPQINLSVTAKIVLRNAIKEIPDSFSFRLQFLRICGLFPFDSVQNIDGSLNDKIFNDFKK